MGKNRRMTARHPISARPSGQPARSAQGLEAQALGKVPADLCEHWDENGAVALKQALDDNPAAYCRIMASFANCL
jgi:hypothetical protein